MSQTGTNVIGTVRLYTGGAGAHGTGTLTVYIASSAGQTLVSSPSPDASTQIGPWMVDVATAFVSQENIQIWYETSDGINVITNIVYPAPTNAQS